MELAKEVPLSNYNVMKEFRLRNKIRARVDGLEIQKGLMDRSNSKYDVNQYQKEIYQLKMLKKRLDNYSVICNKEKYNKIRDKYAVYPSTIEEHCKMLFNGYFPKKDCNDYHLNRLKDKKQRKMIKNEDIRDLEKAIKEEEFNVEYINRFKRKLRKGCINKRKNELLKRLRYEIKQRINEDWYIIFNTLTVSDGNIKKVFSNRSQAWTKYIRSIEREIGIKLYGNCRKAEEYRKNGLDYHRYFAVIERGSKTGRLHIHVIHLLKTLPDKCYDMNKGQSIPKNREIAGFKRFWKYGFSVPIAVRFNNNDRYGRDGWRWPYYKEMVNFKPLKCTDPEAIIRYMGKYITKEYEKPINRKEFTWRTRMSRKLGTKVIETMVENLTNKQIEIMMNIQRTNKMLILNKEMPYQIVRITAIKEYLKRMKKKAPEKLWNMLMGLDVAPNLLKQLKDMIRTKLDYSLPSYGSIRMIGLLAKEGSNIIKEIKEAEIKVLGSNRYKLDVCGNGEEIMK